MLEKEQEWLENFSKWLEVKKHALYSLMKSMLLVGQGYSIKIFFLDMMMELVVIMKFKELC